MGLRGVLRGVNIIVVVEVLIVLIRVQLLRLDLQIFLAADGGLCAFGFGLARVPEGRVVALRGDYGGGFHGEELDLGAQIQIVCLLGRLQRVNLVLLHEF